MRLPVDRPGVARTAVILAAFAVSTGALAKAPATLPVVAANGPQADYPVVVGPAYSAAGTAYTPEDVMNYDQVGLLAADAGAGVSASHHTLPLPSYIEVTSLVSGRTILARVERRGPMDGTALVALSPAALAQLGATAGSPVRVRRVNPPEDQRALVRAGQTAPLRMDTPMSLVEVLKRKLPSAAVAAPTQPQPVQPVQPVATAPAATAPAPTTAPAPVVAKAVAPSAKPAPVKVHRPSATAAVAVPVAVAAPATPAHPAKPELPAHPSAASMPKAPAGVAIAKAGAKPASGFVIQVATFASSTNADKAAHALGAKVSAADKLYRVRTGPFATRDEAAASLAKVKAAGYSDARIQTGG